jgi:hypothetical protein
MPKVITFNGVEYETPSIEQLMEWEMDGGCETPEGEWVEPDHEDSWLRLLGMI